MLLDVAVGLLAGVVLWTFVEYLMHRFAMHGRRGANPLSAEHLHHHAQPEATWPLALDPRLLWRLGAFLAVAAPTAAVAGWPAGVAAGAGFAGGYVYYTTLHHRMHHRPPRHRWQAGRYRRHFAHHFGTPRRNYGVTTGLWDVVFRTAAPCPTVTVPRRLAMPWLLEHGRVRPEHAGAYRVVGTRRRSTTPADARLALADLPPLAD